MASDEEARLVHAARMGDDGAFAALLNANQGAVRGFVQRYAGHWAGADDISQEAFVVAWSRLAQFKEQSSFRSWVCGIAFRLARTARRSHERALRRDADWAEQDPGEPRRFHEDRMAVEDAMRRLPSEQRAAVALCLGEGFSHREAAEILNLPLGTVKAHVARGREKLLRALTPVEGTGHE